jgi:glycerol uptake facilitator-like aquaporin
MAASLVVKLVAEFLGAFLLMLSVLASGGNFLIIGLTLGLIVFLTGGISGAAVNPAVAAGLLVSGTLNTNTFVLYSIVELLGGFAAAYSYRLVA